MNKVMATMAVGWLRDRLREPSTRGGLIVADAAVLGLTVSGEEAQHISEAIMDLWQAARTG